MGKRGERLLPPSTWFLWEERNQKIHEGPGSQKGGGAGGGQKVAGFFSSFHCLRERMGYPWKGSGERKGEKEVFSVYSFRERKRGDLNTHKSYPLHCLRPF